MPDQNSTLQARIPTHPERLTLIRKLLEELSHREVLALAASAHPSNHFQWASLGPGAGLTEDQEDFVDYWTPTLVLNECRTKRELICALDEWALTTESPNAQAFVSRILTSMAENHVDDS